LLFLKLNELGTVVQNAAGDLGSAGAGHDYPVGIPFRHFGLELAATTVLEVEGVEVGQEE